MLLDILLKKQNIVNDVAAELNLYGRTLELSANSEDKNAANIKELANYIRTPDDNETKPVVARSMLEGWNAVKESCQRYLVRGRVQDDNRLEAITEKLTESGLVDTASITYPATLFHLSLQKGVTYAFQLDFSNVDDSEGNEGNYKILVNGDEAATLKISPTTGVFSFEYKATDNIQSADVVLAKADDESEDIEFSVNSIPYTYSYNQYTSYNLQLDMPSNFNVSVTSSITSHAHRLIVDTIVAAVLKNQQQEGYAKYLATAEKARQDLLRSLQARNSFGRVQHDWM